MNKISFRSAKFYKIFLIIVIFLNLLLMIHSVSVKQVGPFIDDIYSYALANSHYVGHAKYLQHDLSWYVADIIHNGYADSLYKQDLENMMLRCEIGVFAFTNNEPTISREAMQNILMPKEENRFNYGSVYWNQCLDVHPPLYYIILHTMCSLFHNDFSVWYGLIPNLIFYAFSLLMIYKFVLLIAGADGQKLALLAVCYYGLSVGAVSTTALIRMYSLLTLCTLVFTYLVTKYFVIHNNPLRFSEGFYLGASVFLGGLTNDFFPVYVACLTVFLIVYLIVYHRLKQLYQYLKLTIFSYGAVVIVFPFEIIHFLYGTHGAESLETRLNGWEALKAQLTSLIQYFNFLKIAEFGNIGIFLLLVVMLGLCVSYTYNKVKCLPHPPQNGLTNKVVLHFILTISVFFLVVVSIATMYKDSRYIVNIYPFCAIIFVCYTYEFVAIFLRKYAFLCVCVLLTFILVFQRYTTEPSYVYANFERYNILAQFHDYSCLYVYRQKDRDLVYRWNPCWLMHEFAIYKATTFVPVEQLNDTLSSLSAEEKTKLILYIDNFSDNIKSNEFENILSDAKLNYRSISVEQCMPGLIYATN